MDNKRAIIETIPSAIVVDRTLDALGKRIVLVEHPTHLEISDGYHTMDELYEHRITLFLALCQHRRRLFEEVGGDTQIWRSEQHSDGSSFDGWFILGIGTKKGEQITYHLPNIKWDEVSFAETLERAPEWDGHTSADVIERLKNL